MKIHKYHYQNKQGNIIINTTIDLRPRKFVVAGLVIVIIAGVIKILK
ncbi:hypothetical protein OZX69_03085 [Lactobacillus sp. ESL0731]|nr:MULTISPECIES: hypothetical protein [unclassified Lactobacillus]WEV51694.1 hypothetical protein OZX63_03085 [Lactobacillus sp. ESL0700]WEV62823.1 hypothetical protein OZX69_03085 [Lactobacillus sp. ESL0731]